MARSIPKTSAVIISLIVMALLTGLMISAGSVFAADSGEVVLVGHTPHAKDGKKAAEPGDDTKKKKKKKKKKGKGTEESAHAS